MKNIDYIKDNFNKKPKIMKAILNMEDIQSVHIKFLKHFKSILDSNKIQQSGLNLNFHSYKNFQSFYFNVTKWLDIKPIDLGFVKADIDEKIKILNLYDIKFEQKGDALIVFPASFEETKIVSPKSWCISNSRNLWNSYNKNKKHVIFCLNNDIYGTSFSEESFTCFDSRNDSVNHLKLRKIIGKNLHSYIEDFSFLSSLKESLKNKKFLTILFFPNFFNIALLLVFVIFFDFIPFVFLAFISMIFQTIFLSFSNSFLGMVNFISMIFAAVLILTTINQYQFPKTFLFFGTHTYLEEKDQFKQMRAYRNSNIENFNLKKISSENVELLFLDKLYHASYDDFVNFIFDLYKHINNGSYFYLKYSSYEKVILHDDREKTKLILNHGFLNHKYSSNKGLSKKLVFLNKRDTIIFALREGAVKPDLDNYLFLRWAIFNNDSELTDLLLTFDSIKSKIDSDWVNMFIEEENKNFILQKLRS